MSKSPIVSQDVVETPTGTKITTFHLSKEAEEALTLPPGTVIPGPAYCLYVQKGDVVRLPNGSTGEVFLIGSSVGGYSKIVLVQPTKKRRWFGLRAAIPLCFVDNDINQLELISTQ